jgi:hypothetical protein
MDLLTSTRRLVAGVDAHVQGSPDALATALAPLRQPDSVAELLGSVLRDEDWLDAVLARSYRHPNGFAKIVLISERSFQLRLHVWRPGDRSAPTIENIHSHHWDFASTIFLGSYRYQEFVQADRGDPFHAYTYHGHQGMSYSLRPVGIRDLRCTFDASLAEGTTYTLSTDVFHRVICDPDRLTVSVVLQGPRRPAADVYIFADHEIETGLSIPLQRLSKGSFARYVGDVQSAIA